MNSDLKLERVLFSIDNGHDLHTLAKFTRMLDEKRAMGELVGGVVLCIGGWQSQMEYSFLMTYKDYYHHVRNSGYVDQQESILKIPGDNRQPCTLWSPVSLEYQSDLGPMKEHSPNGEVLDAFTYVIETGRYFVC